MKKIDCQELRRELSNYLDGDVDRGLRAALDAHLARCSCCSVLVDTTRKAIRILADDRLFTLPLGFNERLRAFLQAHLEPKK